MRTANTATWMLFLGCLGAGCGSVQDVQTSAGATSGAAVDDDDDTGEEDDENEQEVPLGEVPELVQKAARAAVPGFVMRSAEKETEEGSLHYCLEGVAGDEVVEIEVTPAGQVIEIERGEDEDH